MKLSGNDPGHRLGRDDPRRLVAKVLRARMTTEFSEPGSVARWANDAADEILRALRANGDLT